MRLAVSTAERPALALLLMALLLAPAAAVALDLPAPPDPSDPANTISGPLPGPYTGPFAGGVLMKAQPPVATTKAANEVIATFECVDATKTVSKTVKSETGMSIHGPISDAQTQGIIDAFNSVRPPKSVVLTTVVTGHADKIDTWTLTGITFQQTTYNIYVITQASPAMERLVGYIVVALPTGLVTKDDQTPCPDPAPGPMIILGDGFHLVPAPQDPVGGFFDVFFEITSLPDNGIQPFFQYGKVNVYGNGGIAGTTNVRPGETIQMELPPGTYNVQADVGVFGLHFNVDGGTFTSQNPVVLSVTLSVEALVYTIIIVIILVVLVAAFVVVRHFWGGRGGTPSEGEGGSSKQGDGGQAPPPGGTGGPAPQDSTAGQTR